MQCCEKFIFVAQELFLLALPGSCLIICLTKTFFSVQYNIAYFCCQVEGLAAPKRQPGLILQYRSSLAICAADSACRQWTHSFGMLLEGQERGRTFKAGFMRISEQLDLQISKREKQGWQNILLYRDRQIKACLFAKLQPGRARKRNLGSTL